MSEFYKMTTVRVEGRNVSIELIRGSNREPRPKRTSKVPRWVGLIDNQRGRNQG